MFTKTLLRDKDSDVRTISFECMSEFEYIKLTVHQKLNYQVILL